MQVPFYTQLNDEISDDVLVQRRACGICCVKMILGYYDIDISVQDLIAEGKFAQAYDEEKDLWTHEGLVRILRNHGVKSYAQEFRSQKIDLETGEVEEKDNLLEAGYEKIIEEVNHDRPVIVSVKKGFSENTDSHMILVVGGDDSRLIIHDPLTNPYVEIEKDKFMEYWRKFAIFT